MFNDNDRQMFNDISKSQELFLKFIDVCIQMNLLGDKYVQDLYFDSGK